MIRACLILLAVATCACREKDRRSDLQKGIDAEIERLAATDPGLKRSCLKEMRSGDMGAADHIQNPQCYEMTPPRKWSGYWNNGWDWSVFCPDQIDNCAFGTDPGSITLLYPPNDAKKLELKDGIYRITFIGRRTRLPGQFGANGAYDHFMTVDRLIFAEVRRLAIEDNAIQGPGAYG